MSTTDLAAAFKDFENKYNLPPVFQMSDGKTLSAFIITKKGESFFISFESSEADIAEAARFVNEERAAEAEQDIRQLKSYCSAPTLRTPAPETLQ
ncbi:MAG: hypothetical protein ACI4NO_00275 [Oxalobacter sp.]